MALDKPVARVRPEQDIRINVVEDIISLVGCHRQHGMTFALATHHGQEQRLAWPAGLDQHAALQQCIVLAVTVAVIRICPAFDHASVFEIGQWFDPLVDPMVD